MLSQALIGDNVRGLQKERWAGIPYYPTLDLVTIGNGVQIGGNLQQAANADPIQKLNNNNYAVAQCKIQFCRFYAPFMLRVRSIGLYCEGGTLPAIAAAGDPSVKLGIYNMKTDTSGDPSTLVTGSDLTLTIALANFAWNVASYGSAVYLPPGWYMLAAKWSPSFSAGQFMRVMQQHFWLTHVNAVAYTAGSEKYSDALPADVSAVGMSDAGNACYLDFTMLCERP